MKSGKKWERQGNNKNTLYGINYSLFARFQFSLLIFNRYTNMSYCTIITSFCHFPRQTHMNYEHIQVYSICSLCTWFNTVSHFVFKNLIDQRNSNQCFFSLYYLLFSFHSIKFCYTLLNNFKFVLFIICIHEIINNVHIARLFTDII